jgi:hypothetical protein
MHPTELLMRLSPMFFMIAIVLLTRISATRERKQREAEDRVRLRAGLHTELGLIRAMLEDNLRMVAGSAGHVVSTRGSFLLLRISLARLTLLEEAELAALLAAHAMNERLEALLAVSGKPGVMGAYRLPDDAPARNEIARAITAAIARIDAAVDLVAESASVTSPARRRRRRQQEAEIALALASPALPG